MARLNVPMWTNATFSPPKTLTCVQLASNVKTRLEITAVSTSTNVKMRKVVKKVLHVKIIMAAMTVSMSTNVTTCHVVKDSRV